MHLLKAVPIRIHSTPGQQGDSPGVVTLLTGLQGVGHVIADAASAAGTLRDLITGDVGATAQIRASSSRPSRPG